MVYVAGSPSPNFGKLVASRGAEPPFDLMETTDDFLPPLATKGYLDEIDFGKVPNASALAEQDKSKHWVKTWTTQSAIIYNTEKFKEHGIPAPKTYADLKHPKLQGKISVPDIAGGGVMPCLVGMALEGGGDESNIDPALDLIASLEVKAFWKSNSALRTLLKSGDVWAACAGVHTMGRLLGVAPLWATHAEVKPGIFGVLKQGWLVKIKGGKNDAAPRLDRQPVPQRAASARRHEGLAAVLSGRCPGRLRLGARHGFHAAEARRNQEHVLDRFLQGRPHGLHGKVES